MGLTKIRNCKMYITIQTKTKIKTIRPLIFSKRNKSIMRSKTLGKTGKKMINCPKAIRMISLRNLVWMIDLLLINSIFIYIYNL